MELTEQEKEIASKLSPSCRNYSAKMAEEDLLRLTGGYYKLDGHTPMYYKGHRSGGYIIYTISKNGFRCTVLSQGRMTLRMLIITALDLYFTAEKETN